MSEVDRSTEVNENIVNVLARSWSETGIEKGDTVIIHSSLSGFLKKHKSKGIELTPEDVLDSFLEVVGEKGTLVFPTFNFEFTKGKTFDIRNTKSETGILSETARLHPDSIRTGHPLFSFAAIGYHKNRFTNLNNYSAFGIDSPFAIVRELRGKIAMLDVGAEISMTFLHHVEEMENAPHRFHKVFRGGYIDYYGKESIREFNVYSRNLEMGVRTAIKPMVDLLWSKGMYKGYHPGEGTCIHVINAENVYEEVAKVIRDGKSLGMLYRIEKED